MSVSTKRSVNDHTGFASLHPMVLFIFYLGLFLFAILFLHPVFLIVSLLAVILLTFMYDQGKSFKRTWYFFLFMALVVLVVNPLISQRGATILFYLFDRPVTLESMVYGVTMMLSLLTLLIGFMSYQAVMTEDKFLYLFSSMVPKVALLAVLSIRFVPLLKRRLSEIIAVQWTRGVRMNQGTWKERATNGMKILNILLTWSLEEALQTADSMKSRGYGVGRRSSFFTFTMDRRDRIVLVLLMVLLMVSLGGLAGGYGKLTIYPEVEPLFVQGVEWIYFLCFCLYHLVPILVEGREWLVWRSLKS